MIRLLYGSLVRPKRRQIMYNTTPITGVYASALSALGIEPAAGTQAPIAALDKLCKKAFGGEKADRLLRRNKLQAFMGRLRASEQPAAFDEGLFLGLTETVRVCPDRLVFVFKDGTEVAV